MPTDAGRGPARARRVAADQHRGAPEELEARVRAAVVPLGGSVADVSAQRITLRLGARRTATSSPRAARSTCTHGSSARGRSAQTTLGLAGVVLLALGRRRRLPRPRPVVVRRLPRTSGCSTLRLEHTVQLKQRRGKPDLPTAEAFAQSARVRSPRGSPARSRGRARGRGRRPGRRPWRRWAGKRHGSATTAMSSVDSRSRNMQWMRVARLS